MKLFSIMAVTAAIHYRFRRNRSWKNSSLSDCVSPPQSIAYSIAVDAKQHFLGLFPANSTVMWTKADSVNEP